MIKIGTGKSDITAFKEGVGMLGYGMFWNIMESVETPLYARTLIFQTDKEKLAIVNCELCFITPSLKRGVIKKLTRHHASLGYRDENIVLCAQHTHSAPNGYSHHGLYNMNAPGFVIEIYQKIVDGIVDSIINAEASFEECSLFLGKGTFDPDVPVAFQRSIKAYLQNPEAKRIAPNELHLGINREMKLLKFISNEGKDIASINWFGVHTTNLPNSNTKVCSDNKGYASTYFEEEMKEKNPDFIGIFAQGVCGDVTPRYKYNKKLSITRGKWEGKYSDDIESAKYNGRLQYEKAYDIYYSDSLQPIENSGIDSGLRYVDFRNIQVSPKYTGGRENIRTSPACMGIAFLEGTYYDGPGMHKVVGWFARRLAEFMKIFEFVKAGFKPKEWREAMLHKYFSQGKKHIIIEAGERKILGTKEVKRLIIPGWADETIGNLKEFHRRGALDEKAWTPQILPLQIIKLGTVGIAAFPFEITTIAGQRLQKSLEEILLGKGYNEIILCPYSNAYNGYITTYEEYQVQQYEGGHTVFGEWSLAALQTEFEKLAKEMLKPKAERNVSHDVVPPVFTEEDLHKFKHFKGQYAMRRKKRQERIARIRARKQKRINKRISKLKERLSKLNESE